MVDHGLVERQRDAHGDGDQRQRHDDAGQRADDVVAAFQQRAAAAPARGSRATPSAWRRPWSSSAAGERQEQRLAERRRRSRRGARRRRRRPTSQRPRVTNGTPSASSVVSDRQQQARDGGAAQTAPSLAARGAGADAGIALLAAHQHFQAQQHEAADHQHAGQHVGGRAVEGRLELVDDRRGEGVEADEDVEAVFGQQMQADQQRAAADGEPELRQHDAPEHAPWPEAERRPRHPRARDRDGAAPPTPADRGTGNRRSRKPARRPTGRAGPGTMVIQA